MIYTILVLLVIAEFLIIVYLASSKPDVSVEGALKKIKRNLVSEMIFLHDNYNGSEQISFIGRWIWYAKDKIKSAPEHEKKMLKDVVNEL